jgi:hypothetical protein
MWLWEGIEELWVVQPEIGLPEWSKNWPRRLNVKETSLRTS